MLKDTSPWLPILVAVIATAGSSMLVWRVSGNRGFGISAGLLVLALASAALGMIATIAFVWAAVLAVMGIAGLAISWPWHP